MAQSYLEFKGLEYEIVGLGAQNLTGLFCVFE